MQMQSPKPLFVDYLGYLQFERRCSSHTVNAYLKDLNDFYDFAVREFDYSEIKNVHYSIIRSWIVTLVDTDISNRSVNRKISSLKSYYKFLVKTDQIEVNPLVKHKSLKVAKTLQLPFSQKEIESTLELMEASKDFEGLRNHLIVELFYSTGIRRAELIGIQMHNVSMEDKTLKVLGKRNKERIIPLLPSVCHTIKEYLKVREELPNMEDPEYLFLTMKGVKVYESLVYRTVNSYFSLCSEKVKKSPHILRHSFATHLLNEGADISVIKELLGHSSLASTQVYTHNNIARLKEVYKNSHPRD